jgi:hypothetical protein
MDPKRATFLERDKLIQTRKFFRLGEHNPNVFCVKTGLLGKVALVLSACVASSCGGSSSGVLGTNSYPGTWSGTISTAPTVGQGTSGRLSIVISPTDAVSGTDTITIPGTTTMDTGSISTAGDLILSTSTTASGTAIGTISATLEVIDNVLQGAGTIVVNGVTTPVNVSLNLTSTATDVRTKATQPSRG